MIYNLGMNYGSGHKNGVHYKISGYRIYNKEHKNYDRQMAEIQRQTQE